MASVFFESPLIPTLNSKRAGGGGTTVFDLRQGIIVGSDAEYIRILFHEKRRQPVRGRILTSKAYAFLKFR